MSVSRFVIQAVRDRKLVGSLTWLFHVQNTGAMTAPTDQLVHFPIPRKKLEGFEKQASSGTDFLAACLHTDLGDYRYKLHRPIS